MKRVLGIATSLIFLAACSGNAVTPIPATGGGSGGTLSAPDRPAKHLERIKLRLRIPKRRHTGRHPRYIGSGTKSVQVTLTLVNGNTPPAGLTTTVTDNVSSGTCNTGCTVLGPAVPVGTDTIAITTYDANDAGGNALSTDTQAFTITPGIANNLQATLLGIVSKFAVTPPSGTAGTSATSGVTITPEDADGEAITGTYSNVVTLTDGESDGLGATTLSVNNGTGALSVHIHNDTEAGQVTLAYNGQAIASPSLSATATGATAYHGSFAVTSSNPSSTCADSGASICNSGPEVDLYNTSGTGSTANLTSTQTGWTQSAWNSNIGESDNCSSIATIAVSKTTAQNSNNGTVFSVTALNTDASSATCSVTLTGGAGKTESVTVTFTASSIGVNARHHGVKP